MSVLNITTNASGKVVTLSVDNKVIDNVSEVSQGFYRGALVATIKANFDSITVTEQPVPVPAPALTVAFSPGSVTGSTQCTITEEASEGNHFAYAITDEMPETPNVDAVVSGVSNYTSALNILNVTPGKCVSIYELTSTNNVVKFTAHLIVADEINTGD